MAANNRVLKAKTGKFVVNGSYLREQASEAFRTFVAPLSGVYGAATGDDKASANADRIAKKRA